MHISDGIINTTVCIAADAVAAGLIYISARKAEPKEIPAMGLVGAALFVTSLLHFPIAGTSVHLGLFGVAGIILGRRSFPVVFVALLFQSLIFQHGGLLTLGLNTINMGVGAWAGWLIWSIRKIPEYPRAMLAGFAGIILPALLMLLEFRLSGYESPVFLLLLIYLLVAAIEAGITLAAVIFFRKVKPEIIGGTTDHETNQSNEL